MNLTKKLLLAAAVALFACVSGHSQIAPGSPRPAVNIDLSKLSPELRALVTQLQTQATELKGLARDLRAKMEGKTAEERKLIVDQFRKEHAGLIDAQRTLAKTIRSEMKALRELRKSTG